MTLGIVKILVKCGALPPKNSGPAHPKSEEEAKRIKGEQTARAARLRRKMVREVIEKGEQLPAFPRGRPRKYTPEEAIIVKAAQNRDCINCYRQRVKEGIVKLEAIVCAQNELGQSTDEHFFVGTS